MELHYPTGERIGNIITAPDYQRGLSISNNNLGNLAIASRDSATAEQHYRTALSITERLAAADPDNAQYQRDLSVSHNNLRNLAKAVEKDPAYPSRVHDQHRWQDQQP